MLSNVIDELVSFRTKVRSFALAAPEAAGGVSADGAPLSKEARLQKKTERQQLLKDRAPLLQACDSLRRDLAIYGIDIKVRLFLCPNPPG